MIGVGTSLLFDRHKGGGCYPVVPPFNEAMVDAWFMSGLSNVDKPSSIRGVKGNEMQLKNFAYSLSSGFGKYKVDFNSWKTNNNISNRNSFEFSALFNKDETPGRRYILQHPDTEKINSFRIKVVSNHTAEDIYELEYRYLNSDKQVRYFKISSDGEYTLPASFPTDETEATYTNRLGFDYVEYGIKDISFTITQLPSAYDGALVFDGVDDYGICNNLPILDDYTLICRREIISIKNSSAVASKRTYPDDVGNFGAFIFERVFASGGKSTYSFGSPNDISEFDSNEVVYQTKTSYNGTTITSSSSNDSNTLCLGANAYNISLGRCQEFSNVAIYYFALYDKSLTLEEIETEKERLNEEWLKRSKVTIPEPDVYYDLSLKDNSSPTRNIIDDLSGNGHEAEIFNAAYVLGSGYGKYVVDWSTYRKSNVDLYSEHIYKPQGSNGSIAIGYVYLTSNIPSYSIKVEGLDSGSIDYYYRNNEGKQSIFSIKQSGIHELPICYKEGTEGTNNILNILSTDAVTIAQIPDYEGAFVFDGIDDWAMMKNVTKGFKTLFMEVVPMKIGGMLYDQRISTAYSNFGIYNETGKAAYTARNDGQNYINGKLNNDNITTDSLISKRTVVTIVNDEESKCQSIFIASAFSMSNYCNMALYKLIGFYDELTPLQIEKVINDYKLKYD